MDTIQEKERLSALYPELSDQQLTEVALGLEAGIDAGSYADASLTPEQMKTCREKLIERKALAVTAFECRYFYGAIKYFEFFDSSREILYSSLVEEKNGVSFRDIERWASSNGQLQGKVNKIYESLTRNITVNDIFESSETLPEKYAEIIRGIKVRDTVLSLEISLPVNSVFDIYKSFGKGESDKNAALTVTPDTAFSVRPKLSSAHDTFFTLALNGSDFSISISAVPNRSATKSDADIAICIKDKDSLWYDNGAKYFDTSLLVAGLRS
jgi:hypothetical protein